MTDIARTIAAEDWIAPLAGHGQTLSILILDDNEFDRRRIARLAEQMGLDLRITNVAALADLPAALDDAVFDLAFLDYRLPEGDGLDALQMIRSHPRNTSAAIIMVAGETLTDVVIQAIRGGCDDFIEKDRLDPDHLKEAVQKALEQSLNRHDSGYDETLRKATYEIMKGISDSCFNEMRPILSRMLREIRYLRRANHFQVEEQENSRICRIEASCMSLWRYLAEMDSYRDSWKKPLH